MIFKSPRVRSFGALEDPTNEDELAQIFQDTEGKEFTNWIEGFDFGQVTELLKSTGKPAVNVLAPSFGDLSWEYLKEADGVLREMIKLSMNELGQARKEDRELSWSTVTSIFKQCPFLEVDEGSEEGRNRVFVNKTIDKGRGGKGRTREDQSVTLQVQSWFNTLINNDDVYKSTSIDMEAVKDIVARTGVEANDSAPWYKSFFQEDSRKKTFMDVGVIRFPDSEHPYFRVYRIQISAWAICRRTRKVLGRTRGVNNNGLIGDYNTCTYRPRQSFFEKMCPNLGQRSQAEWKSRYNPDKPN